MNTTINDPTDSRNCLAEELSIACSNGDLNKVKYMLTRCIDKPLLEFGIFSALSYACDTGQLEIINFLLTSHELITHADIHYNNEQPLRYACSSGQLKVVRYLLSNPKLKEHATPTMSCLSSACEYGHLKIVRYLLTSDEFKPFLTIENDYHSCLSSACNSGQLEIVQFLLMSPFIKNHADIEYVSPNYTQMGTPLASACAAGHLDIIKFLLYSKKLNKNAHLHAYDDIAFRRCVEAKQENVLNYFIYDLNFSPNKKTYELLEKNINRYDIQCIKSLVSKRDLITAIGEVEFCEEMKQIKI